MADATPAAPADRDHFEAYYADKLWASLPEIYRTSDTDDFEGKGPLRELVDRIGAQAAIVRRGIDRLWADQSIETCDDWVIPYLGDLLATNLVAALDARGRRADVAKTVYYRRRKGTVAVLEELAADVTGWDAKVVEFFRRLGRTRHGLDPQIGLPAAKGDDVDRLRIVQGLVGPLTRTPMGGTADLRNIYGATKAHTAFDEFAHTADVRPGRGRTGWHNIPRLGVFVWRLKSSPVGPVTPVAVAGCDDWYTFDPTGRDVPLFAAARRGPAFGSRWVSPDEWQLPGPVSGPLYAARADRLYPDAVAVHTPAGPVVLPPGAARQYELLDPALVTVRPERGRFRVTGSPPPGRPRPFYHYGFSSEVGAGPYDRRLAGCAPRPDPAPAVAATDGGTLPALPATGTVTIADSLTYAPAAAAAPAAVKNLTVKSANKQRPLVRLGGAGDAGSVPASVPVLAEWAFVGEADSTLVLDGLLVSGGDVVLRGRFDTVVVRCCTLDPGTSGADLTPARPFAVAADGRDLASTRLWVEARVRRLCVERSITGPVRTRLGGAVETLTATDSILQALPAGGPGAFAAADVADPYGLAVRLRRRGSPPAAAVDDRLSAATKAAADAAVAVSPPAPPGPPAPLPPAVVAALVADLNAVVAGPPLFDPALFAAVPLSPATLALAAVTAGPGADPADVAAVNRRLLAETFRAELGDAAVALTDGTLALSRCTVLGPVAAHRLRASECLLADAAVVDDAQHGCVRFSAVAEGSAVPRRFESVRVDPGAALFASTDFGHPAYAQLLPTADAAVRPLASATDAAGGQSILEGAEDGSEMGAFARERTSAKRRGLLAKYREYMPVGLVPVVVEVT